VLNHPITDKRLFVGNIRDEEKSFMTSIEGGKHLKPFSCITDDSDK
jgi:hypothetical protein